MRCDRAGAMKFLCTVCAIVKTCSITLRTYGLSSTRGILDAGDSTRRKILFSGPCRRWQCDGGSADDAHSTPKHCCCTDSRLAPELTACWSFSRGRCYAKMRACHWGVAALEGRGARVNILASTRGMARAVPGSGETFDCSASAGRGALQSLVCTGRRTNCGSVSGLYRCRRPR